MNKKVAIISLIVLFVVIAGGVWVYSMWNTYAPATYVQESATTTSTGTATADIPTFTMASVKTHNSASSCYTVISGKVYDLTFWINVHPGGKQAILSLCGTDGTVRFEKQHGEEKKPTNILARFYIGTISPQ